MRKKAITIPFLLIRNDITKVDVDAIVNTANSQLKQGSGTSRAIYLAAGEKELINACKKIGYCALGKAVITEAFNLPSRYIIHTVGPAWKDGKSGEDKILYSAYFEALQLAKSYQLESIAFPFISTGNYGFPRKEALKIAVAAIGDFLMENDMLVYLVIYDKKSLMVSQKLFAIVREYIDDHYVDDKEDDFFDMGRLERSDAYDALDEYEYISFRRNTIAPSSSNILEPSDSRQKPKRSLDDLVNNLEETFSQMLLRLIDERGLKDSNVYKKANIDRKHFSKIRSNINYAPNKKTVMALAISLELTLDEAKDLMERAGFAFSRSSKCDVIICCFLESRRYNINEINEVLFTYDLPLLGA